MVEVKTLPISSERFGTLKEEQLRDLCRDVKCDRFFSLATYPSRMATALIQALSPTQSIGFVSEHFDVCVRPSSRLHMIEFLFELARAGVKPGLQIGQYLDPSDGMDSSYGCRARSILSHFPTGNRVLIVHTEASELCKRIEPGTIRSALLSFVQGNTDVTVLVIDYEEFQLDHKLEEYSVYSIGGLSLGTAASLVLQSDGLLTIDSCFRHLADAHRIPTVAIYRTTSPALWGKKFGPGVDIECKPGKNLDLDKVVASLNLLCGTPVTEGTRGVDSL